MVCLSFIFRLGKYFVWYFIVTHFMWRTYIQICPFVFGLSPLTWQRHGYELGCEKSNSRLKGLIGRIFLKVISSLCGDKQEQDLAQATPQSGLSSIVDQIRYGLHLEFTVLPFSHFEQDLMNSAFILLGEKGMGISWLL